MSVFSKSILIHIHINKIHDLTYRYILSQKKKKKIIGIFSVFNFLNFHTMAETHLVQGIPNNFYKKLIYIYIFNDILNIGSNI